MSKRCNDCGQPIDFRKDGSKWIPINLDREWAESAYGDGTGLDASTRERMAAGAFDHWKTCDSDAARGRRIRHFIEPGVFPASISALIAYKRCPQWYQRVKLQGENDPKGPYAQLGIEFHRFAEAWLTDAEVPELHPPIELWDEFTRAVEAFKRMAWDTSHLIGVEERMTYEWDEGAMKVQFMAVVDALMIEGDLAIIPDWKTGWQVSDQEEMDKDLQSLGNCLVVSKHYPQINSFLPQQIQVRRGCRIMLPRDDAGRPKPYTRADLDRFEPVLRSEIRRIMSDTDFVANPDCTYCPPGAHARSKSLDVYRSVDLQLANGKMAIELAEPATADEARRIAAGAKFAGALYGAAKKALDGYTSRNGPITLGDWGAFGHWASESIECTDIEWLIDWLTSHGMRLDDYVRPDTAKLRTLLKNYPELKSIVNSMVTSEFAWRKDVAGAKKKNAELEEQVMRPFYQETQTAELKVLEGGKG